MSAVEAHRAEHQSIPQGELTVVDIVHPTIARDSFFQLVQDTTNMPLLQTMANFIDANLTHSRRAGAKEGETIPDFVHGYHVGILLAKSGITNPLILAAALGHDTFEDTRTNPATLRGVFEKEHGPVAAGAVVAVIVLLSKEVNGENELPLAEYYRVLSAQTGNIRAIKVADRMTKILSLIRMGIDREYKDNKTVEQKLAEILSETDEFYGPLAEGIGLQNEFDEIVEQGKKVLNNLGNDRK